MLATLSVPEMCEMSYASILFGSTGRESNSPSCLTAPSVRNALRSSLLPYFSNASKALEWERSRS